MTSAKALNAKTKPKIEDFKTYANPGYSPTKHFVIYHQQMLKLLCFPKPTHDQLCIELPCLMGFRASEVTTWRAEHIDFAHGDTLVLDAKKKQLFLIPLNLQVATHAEKLLKGRHEGYVLRSRSNAQPDPNRALNPASVWHVWRKWSMRARLFNWEEFSPAVGRRFFAAYWYHYLQQSLMTLSMIMRHSEPRITLGYVEKLIFYEDLKQDYKKFQFSFLQKDVNKEVEDVVAEMKRLFKVLERNLKSKERAPTQKMTA